MNAPLYHAMQPVVTTAGTQTQAVAMQRYHNADMPAMVGILNANPAAPIQCYTVLEPHKARELAANIIACAEIAERHNLDVDRRAERKALAAAISPGAVERALS